jgi:asparagine synthase (glutamine-hydrolysing)
MPSPRPRTIFAGVQRLDAAHALHATAAQAHVQRHWTPRFVEGTRGRFETLREEFVALLRDAVAREIEPGRTGSFLSGGTDSSTIAGLVGRVSGARPRTYSIGFDAAGYDEMAYARIAARAFDADHHEYYVTPDDLVDGIPAVAAHHDQPFGNSSAAPAYYCARLAHDDGVTRLLAGDGGDELFGGNSRYATQRLLEPYHSLPGVLRHRVLEPWFANSRALRAIPGLRQATGYIRHARPPMPDRLQSFNLVMLLGVDNVLQPQLADAVDAAAPLAPAAGHLPPGAGARADQPHAGVRLEVHARRFRPAQGEGRD